MVCRRHRSPRGVTLIEAMVTLCLLGFVLAIGWQVLAPNLSVWDRSRARADVEQNSLVLQNRLALDLRASDAASVTILASPPACSFVETDDSASYDPDTGRPVWQKMIVYMLDTANHVLYRKVYSIPSSSLLAGLSLDPSGVPQFSQSALSQQVSAENGTEQTVGSYVTAFAVSLPVNQLLHVQVGFTFPTGNGSETASRTLDVRMRN